MINIQNIDECFKWSLVRYLNYTDHHPARITKGNKDFVTNFDFRGIKFPVKIRDIHKIEKKNSTGISAFGYENKEKHSIYVSKNCCEERFIINRKIRPYVLIKDFNTFMYDHTFHCGKKPFCYYLSNSN